MTYTYLQYAFGATALLLGVAAYAVRSRRSVLVWGAASALIAAFCAYYHVFWVGAIFALMIPWALVCAGPWIDSAWRAKVGFCAFLACAAVLCLYPTYVDERFDRPDVNPDWTAAQQTEMDGRARTGEFGFGWWIRANVPFRLVRGLDLKGGFRAEYGVDVQEAIRDRRDRYYDDIRTGLARKFGITAEDKFPTVAQIEELRKRVTFEKPRTDVGKIVIKFTSEEDAAVVNNEFLKRFLQELSVVRANDKKVITFTIKKETEEKIREEAITQAKEKVHNRVDTLGLKEATVSVGGSDDIVIEVPGSDTRQFEEIKSIISQTARLEFKLPDDEANFFKDVAMSAEAGKCPTCDAEGIQFSSYNVPGVTNIVTFAILRLRTGEKMEDARKRFRSWVDTTLQVPDTHQVVLEKMTRYDSETNTYTEEGWKAEYVFSKAEVTGDMIKDARRSPVQDPGQFGKWQVNLEFSPLGSDNFERITGANVGKRFLIILDEIVESGPTIQQKIGGGSARITMGGSSENQLENAKKLELVLKSGALPAPIEYKGEQRIGPSLGVDAIVQGLKGGVFGAILVFIVMVVIYARAGFIANIAVLFNLVLQIAILAMFGASMTLPGMAGLSLTIGIAVDANVLINERIRDELRAGKSPRQAVDIGYDRALSAIIDGHVTTLISGLILFQYGSGPIKGFAVTLIIGMLTSLFTGVVCTRLIFDWVVRWRKVKQLSLG